jgi:hypothetical protein
MDAVAPIASKMVPLVADPNASVAMLAVPLVTFLALADTAEADNADGGTARTAAAMRACLRVTRRGSIVSIKFITK